MAKNDELEKVFRQSNYIVNRLLYEKELSDSQKEFLNEYINNYHKLLDKHLEGQDEQDTLEILQLYEMVLNELDTRYEELSDLPSTKMIYEKIEEHNKLIDEHFDKLGKEKEMSLAKKRELENRNGFGEIALILGSTILAGIGLGALLWFIR